MRSGHQNHILMIDDDESLLGIMNIKLQHLGYRVESISQAVLGYQKALSGSYDVIIMDVSMPGMNGIDLCKNVRAQGVLTPILMLSGNTEKPSIIKSLELGADDYLTKPFSHNELAARLTALVRRNRKSFSTRRIEKEGVELDTITGISTFAGKECQLTRKEALLLKRLMCESPEAVERNTLLKDVWEIDDLHTSNRLDVYVRRLRAKLEAIGASNLIHTQRGKGYCFRHGDKADD